MPSNANLMHANAKFREGLQCLVQYAHELRQVLKQRKNGEVNRSYLRSQLRALRALFKLTRYEEGDLPGYPSASLSPCTMHIPCIRAELTLTASTTSTIDCYGFRLPLFCLAMAQTPAQKRLILTWLDNRSGDRTSTFDVPGTCTYCSRDADLAWATLLHDQSICQECWSQHIDRIRASNGVQAQKYHSTRSTGPSVTRVWWEV